MNGHLCTHWDFFIYLLNYLEFGDVLDNLFLVNEEQTMMEGNGSDFLC